MHSYSHFVAYLPKSFTQGLDPRWIEARITRMRVAYLDRQTNHAPKLLL